MQAKGYQLCFYPTSGSNVKVSGANCTKLFAFESPLCTVSSASASNKEVVMYSYTAPSAGQVRITLPQEYHASILVTKNQPVTYDSYHAYFDNQEGRNLWNQFIDLKNLVNADGTINTGNANHYATHYIAVKEGDTITWGPHQDSMFYGAVGYNAEKVGVTGAINVGSQNKPANANIKKVATFTDDNNPVALDDNQDYSIYTYTVPAGVSYVRVLLRKEVPAYFQVQKNNEFDVAGYWDLMGGDMESPYFGKNSVWFGDSICQATQDSVINGVWYGGFVGRTSKALNMNYDHNGESGWSLSTARPGRIVNRLIAAQEDEPAGGFDVVMLHGGTNDAWQSMPVGNLNASYNPADFNINTYGGALEELFYYATTLYGDTAEINYILNYQQPLKDSGQVSQMDAHYALALRICEKWGVTPIDLYHDEAVREACELETIKIYQDYCHAGARGYDIITPFIVDKMLAATTGNTWLEDNGIVAGKIVDSMKNTVANSAYFTADSKAAFAAAVTGANNAEKLAAALSAAPALEQVEGNYIPVFDMTKYAFAQQKDYAVKSVQDLVWLSCYNNQRGNNNGKTVFGNLPGYIPADWTIHQTADIDMNSGSYNGYYTAIEIGKSNPFDAVYDGHGHKISNWKDGTAATDAGGTCATAIFHNLKDTTLKNLTIDKAETYSSGWDALLVGRAQGNVVIENCHVTNSKMTKKGGNGMAAILLQPMDTNTTSADKYLVKNCTVSNTEFVVDTTSTFGNFGFLVSRAVTDNHKIENCYSYNNTLNLVSNSTVVAAGGILGEAYRGRVKNCGTYNNTFNAGNGAMTDDISSIVGRVAAGNTLTISGSYSDDATRPLTDGDGTTNATNCYVVGAEGLTVEYITNGMLAADLRVKTGADWGMKAINETTAIPMIAEDAAPVHLIEIENAGVFATDYKTGKLMISEGELPSEIWKYQDQTMLAADLQERVFTKDEKWTVAEYLLGDCMGGDSLDTADAVALMRALLGDVTEGYQADRADVNCDGQVSLADVVRLLRYIAAGRSV